MEPAVPTTNIRRLASQEKYTSITHFKERCPAAIVKR